MKRMDLYKAFKQNQITLEQFAEATGMTPVVLKRRMTYFGSKFPTVLKVLDDISENKITRDEAAATLQVGQRAINYLMARWNAERPIAEYLLKSAKAEVKWEMRKKFAIEYIAGTMELEEASESAGLSDRQMRRWIASLLEKHMGMTYKELKKLSLRRRWAIANQVEEDENLALAKQNVLKAIAQGEKAIEEEALERVTHKRKRRANVRPAGG